MVDGASIFDKYKHKSSQSHELLTEETVEYKMSGEKSVLFSQIQGQQFASAD